MAALLLLLITVSVLRTSSECPAVLDIKSETSCNNSTNNSTYISISCTVSCSLPVIALNGNDTNYFMPNETVTKTCMSSSGMSTSCGYLPCPDTPDSSINITFIKQGFIPADKLTSCMYTVACRSSKPNCTQKTKNFLLKECDIVPTPECSVPSTTVTKVVFNTTTVTMATTVTSSILEVLPCSCSQLLTSDDIEPTCDCTSCYDVISTSTISLIPTSISCNMSSQLTHTTTSIITTTITSTTYSMCSSSVPVLSPETTYPTISLSQSAVKGVKTGIGISVTVLIGLILVIVVMGVCLCRSRRQQTKCAAINGPFFKNEQAGVTGDANLTPEQLDKNDPQTKSFYIIDHETTPNDSISSSM